MTLIELLFVVCPLAGCCWGIKAGWSHGLLGVLLGGIGGTMAGFVFWGVLMLIVAVGLWLDSKRRGDDFSLLGKAEDRDDEMPSQKL